MTIDLRGLSGNEPFIRVRELLRDSCPEDETLDLLIEEEGLAKRLKGFMSMSGCRVEIHPTPDGWIVRMTGRSCSCG